MTISRMLFEGLFRASDDGATPALAHSMTISEDLCTYSFELRPSCWSDGSAVTAYDFEYAWKSVLHPHSLSESAQQLFIIVGAKEAKLGKIPTQDIGVQAINQNVLVVRLERPDPYFLERLCHPVACPVPSKLLSKQPNWDHCYNKNFVCNGPFILDKWEHGDHLRVTKNPLYWDKNAVQLHSIFITMVEDEHTELNMYENGELDWAGSPNSSVPPEALPHLKTLLPDELFIQPLAGTYCYKFNTKLPPFNNAKIRQAFSRAIERQPLIDNILQAGQLAACHLIPPCLNIDQGAFCTLTHPRALFEEGLEEMGWTRQTMPTITLIFSRSEKHQKVAQAVQQQWNQIFDIKVNLQSYEWNIFLEKLARGEYQVGGRGWIGEFSDPKSFLEIYLYDNQHELGSGNDTGWEDPLFRTLLERADQTTDKHLRDQLLAEAESRLLSSCAISPIYHSTACYLKKPYLKNVYLSKFCDLDFKTAYLENSNASCMR
ncbi:MAG: peptide ABC transporter substrate-binding protein [Verrucomicrobia bacterium]|nr:peptide ABC transporter substrate-binding protein [Verrucomicrobiota bacterium]